MRRPTGRRIADGPPAEMRTGTVSRRRVLQALGATAGLMAVGRPGLRRGWAAQAEARRTQAILPPGTRPYPGIAEGTDTMPQVEHIIMYMQENHSYDNYLGMHPRGDGFTLDGQHQPVNTNPDLQNQPVPLFHMESGCDTTNGASQGWNASHISWNNGAMDGFVRAAGGGTGSMGYWDGTDLPFYYSLADTFVVCDRWYSSVLAQTFPNRRYFQAATSLGIVSTDITEVLATPDAPNGVIWDRLNAHGITWNDYVIDLPDIALFPNFGSANQRHLRQFDDFLLDCEQGTLPQVSIISPGNETYTEESPADIQNGEAYSAAIINAVLQSPAWERTVLFFTYDEHGGYYDHVPPPAAVAPDAIAPRITVPPDEPGGFDRYGIRVPSFVISPFAKANYVSHVTHDHTSVLKFIETKFNLGALTYRDANADDLLDTLDFANPGFLDPPTLADPGLPLSGSVCQPLPRPPTRAVHPTGSSTSTSTVAVGSSAPGSSTTGAAARRASTGSSATARAVTAAPRFTG